MSGRLGRLFRRDRRQTTRSRRLYAVYELLYTGADFAAAAFFVVGSVMFFWESLFTPATWCFLLGSLLFAAKPTIRLVRELHLLRIGDTEDLAERVDGS